MKLLAKVALFGMVLTTLTITGCSSVKPWQRATLAEKSMLLDGYPMDTAFDEHIYFSKEATSGGTSVGGGGCGCN